MTPEEQKRIEAVMETCITEVQKGIASGDASEPLKTIAKLPIADVRLTLHHTQPPAWALVYQPLVDSLTDEQAPAVLASLVAVFIQAKANVFQNANK